MSKPPQKSPALNLRSARRLGWCVAACTVLAAGGWLSAEAPRASATIPALQETPVRSYRAFRRMHAASEKFSQEGWVDCWTDLDDQGFRYQIVSERGSDYIREKVLKTLLRREQELIAAGNANRAEISDANYEFAADSLSGEVAGGERTVLLKPRRKDVLLVNGKMVISGDGTELLRVEGRLAKNPSFWTNMVDIVREFARVDGVRVPITTDTIARIKFVGTSRMDVRYHYETINGRPVSLAARQSLPGLLSRE